MSRGVYFRNVVLHAAAEQSAAFQWRQFWAGRAGQFRSSSQLHEISSKGVKKGCARRDAISIRLRFWRGWTSICWLLRGAQRVLGAVSLNARRVNGMMTQSIRGLDQEPHSKATIEEPQ
jgi:hypothetical protein